MSEPVSNLQKTDCGNCRVMQAQFGDQCASCYFVARQNENKGKFLKEQSDIANRVLKGWLKWLCVAAIIGGIIFLISLWR